MEISRIIQGGQTQTNESGVSENKTPRVSPVNTELVLSNSVSAKGKPLNEKDLKKAVDRLNKFVETDNVRVEYDIHPQFKDIMIKIVDKKTGDVITEVPPKKILDMVAKMCELAGVIFDKKA